MTYHHVRKENTQVEGKAVEMESETGRAGEEAEKPRRIPGARRSVFSASGTG